MVGNLDMARARQANLQRADLSDVAWIVRPVITTSETGGQTEGTPLRIGPFPARLTPLTAQERLATGTVTPGASYLVAMPAGSDVRLSDRLEVSGQRPTAWTRTLQVLAAGPQSNEVIRYLRCGL